VYGDAQVSINADILWITKIGGELQTLTAFRCESGIKVIRGCFIGTVDEFAAAVAKKHKKTKQAKEYELCIDLIKLRFGIKEKRSKVIKAAQRWIQNEN
jgi:hypothetical protein